MQRISGIRQMVQVPAFVVCVAATCFLVAVPSAFAAQEGANGEEPATYASASSAPALAETALAVQEDNSAPGKAAAAVVADDLTVAPADTSDPTSTAAEVAGEPVPAGTSASADGASDGSDSADTPDPVGFADTPAAAGSADAASTPGAPAAAGASPAADATADSSEVWETANEGAVTDGSTSAAADESHGAMVSRDDVAVEETNAAQDNQSQPANTSDQTWVQLIADGTYVIESASNLDQVLDVVASQTSAGTNVTMWNNNDHSNQRWVVTYLGNGLYKLAAEHSGLVLDVAGYGTTDGTNVQQWTWEETDNQLWYIQDAGNGFYYIISKGSGLYLDVEGGRAGDSVNVQIWSKTNNNGGLGQMFRFSKMLADGCYSIASYDDRGYFVDVEASSPFDGANVSLFTGTGAANQKFEISRLHGTYYRITCVNSKESLDVVAGGKNNGTNVTQWASYSTANQAWHIEFLSDGTVRFQSEVSGLYLDVQGGYAGRSVNVQTWELTNNNAGAGQKWYLAVEALGWVSEISADYYYDPETCVLTAVHVSNPYVSSYTSFALATAADDSHGYDQIYRWGERGDYDCSSLVITACRNAGINTGSATYTGNMKSNFIAAGFTWIPWAGDYATLQVGDILLNIDQHTAIYVGNGRVVEASLNENGKIAGGKPGDQTGREIRLNAWRWGDAYGYWDGVLRLNI